MKDKNKNNSNLLDNTTSHLKSFIKGLKEISDELSETEFEQYLEADVLPMLLEDEVVYDDSIWNKMDIVKITQIDSTLEYRGLSVEQAIRRMNVNAVCWILNHLSAMKDVISDSRGAEGMRKSHGIQSLKSHCAELQEWINADTFERLQEYQSEINS